MLGAGDLSEQGGRHVAASERLGRGEFDLRQAREVVGPGEADFDGQAPVTTSVSVRPPHSVQEPS